MDQLPDVPVPDLQSVYSVHPRNPHRNRRRSGHRKIPIQVSRLSEPDSSVEEVGELRKSQHPQRSHLDHKLKVYNNKKSITSTTQPLSIDLICAYRLLTFAFSDVVKVPQINVHAVKIWENRRKQRLTHLLGSNEKRRRYINIPVAPGAIHQTSLPRVKQRSGI